MQRHVVLNGKLTAWRQRALRVATCAGWYAVITQDLSEQFLNVVVGSASDDRRDEFDFDADFPIDIDFALHTLNIAQDQHERKRKIAI